MGSANAFVPVALALFFPAVYLARRTLGPTRGVIAALVVGWLFLPSFGSSVLDVPLLGSKVSFVPAAILLVSAPEDWRRWLRLRLQWVDAAAAALFVVPFATALSNGLGAYEGASATVEALGVWVAPYALGRLYLGAPRAAREYAVWLVGAGLAYVPLCLWEIRMSPQLHRLVYGYRAAGGFAQAVRYGGYRPSVFLAHGLAVGMFMATATLVAYWLRRSRGVERIWDIPLGWATAALAVTTVLCKSTGAILLLLAGVAALEATRLTRRTLPILLLALVPVTYCAARLSGWTANGIVEQVTRLDPERAQSVLYRVTQEQRLLAKAEQRPWLGWGRWGRSRIYDEDGRDVSVTDSLWIIALGLNGIVGLVAIGSMLLAPVLLLLRRARAHHWCTPALAPVAALATATLLWVVDSLLNNMNGPLYPAVAGGIVTLLYAGRAGAAAPSVASARGGDRRRVRVASAAVSPLWGGDRRAAMRRGDARPLSRPRRRT